MLLSAADDASLAPCIGTDAAHLKRGEQRAVSVRRGRRPIGGRRSVTRRSAAASGVVGSAGRRTSPALEKVPASRRAGRGVREVAMEPGIRLLGDRYELLNLLASGGMGRVWRARDRLLDRPVAVKILRSEFTGDPAFVARFRAEAQHAAVLHHPNIATVFDYGEARADGERIAYLVMELVEGESLSELLLRERRLDVPRTLTVLRSTSAALAAAHDAGLVHRDVKPGNVLVGADGTVKITDFGIAWSASSVPLTATGQVIGTAHYLSPEQAQGAKASPASDVYALGAVAYECLAGRRAFEGENSVQIAVKQIRENPDPLPPDVPPAVRRLVEQAMAKDPADRCADGGALPQAVDAVLAGSAAAPRGRTGTAIMPLPLLTTPAEASRVPLLTAGRRMAVERGSLSWPSS